MIREAIEKILSLAPPTRVEMGERTFFDRKLVPDLLPEPKTLTIHTLSGIKDYLKENPDGLDLNTVLLHVLSPTEVNLFSRLTGPFEQRKEFLAAQHLMPTFQFDKYMDIETFIVELQAKFVQDETTAAILQLVGTISDEIIATYADDGVTQGVTAKTGLGRVEQRAVPNPVTLRPFRTFNEIEQVPGRFVLRLRSGVAAGARPSVALFEADGGAWQLEAIRRIQHWLRTAVPEEVAVIA
jgi:hypothetical protein